MPFRQDVIESPYEVVNTALSSAFDLNHKNRRQFLRVVHHALSIAKQRGYLYSYEFMDFFRHPDDHIPKTTRKLLEQLFEYISEAEFAQLVIGRKVSL